MTWGSSGGGSSMNFGINVPGLSEAFARDVIEMIMPKETRKQAQKQLMMEAIVRSYPVISKLPAEEKKKFYSQILFPAYGMYQPPLFRGLFGAKPEAIAPLPEGGAEFQGGEKTKTSRGRMVTEAPGIRIPPSEPFTFPESVGAGEERELRELQKKALIEDIEARTAERKRPRPWAPLTEAEYEKYHRPLAWSPGSKEEYKEVHPPPVRGWTPGSKEEYKEVHPQREKAEKETPEEKKAGKKEDKQIAALREELRRAETDAEKRYDQFLDGLKKQMGVHNKQADKPKSKLTPIEYIQQLPNYLSKDDWFYLASEGKLSNKAITEARVKLNRLLTGQWPAHIEEGIRLRRETPQEPSEVTTKGAPKVREKPPGAPTIIKYDAQGNRVE